MNRLDIVHAYYLYYSWNHKGQGSREYERLSGIMRYYTPAQRFESAFENLAQVEIYENLARRSGAQIGYTACLCCGLDVMGMGLCARCEKADCAVSGDECCNCEEG